MGGEMLTAKPRMPYSELGFTEQLCYNYGVSFQQERAARTPVSNAGVSAPRATWVL